MLSLFVNAKPRKTTLVFPNEQKLWAFFAVVEVSDFRIESSKHAFTGNFHRRDIDLAIQKLDAIEIKHERKNNNFKTTVLDQTLLPAQMLLPSFGLIKNRTSYQ